MKMATLQKILSQIRELRHEEIDLVGGMGGTTSEVITYTTSQRTFQGTTVTITDDANVTTVPDVDA
jgi:hypothetical protein